MIKSWLIAAWLLPLVAAAGGPDPQTTDQQRLGIAHEQHPAPGVWVSGPPDEAAISRAAEAGVRHIVNLMPAEERPDYDVADHAEAHDIEYHRLPISGANDLDIDAVKRFDDILRHVGEDAVLLHCASGNRVGAMMALRAGLLYDLPPEDAIDIGKHYGLTRLEPAVVELLSAGTD